MKPPWSPMLALMTVAAVAHTFVAASALDAAEHVAEPVATPEIAAGAGLATLSILLASISAGLELVSTAAAEAWRAGIADTGATTITHIEQWLANGYQRAPALMLGLAVLLTVPPLALAGLFFGRGRGRSQRNPDATVALPRRRQEPSQPRATLQTEISPWPTEAWVEAEGIPGGRRVIGRTLVRIGREDDNDIRFAVKTVHRYHAVIRRTTDGMVMITDVSGKDGNGVLVNGARVLEARLAKGDVINLGEVTMRFDARPV